MKLEAWRGWLISQISSIKGDELVRSIPLQVIPISKALVLFWVSSLVFSRVLFLCTGIFLITLLLIVCFCIENFAFLRFLSEETAQNCCTFLCCVLMKVWIAFNPQICVKNVTEKRNVVSNHIPNGSIILVNHISYFDVPVAVSTMPLSTLPGIRTCYKSSLKYIPLFGNLPKYCGHFPVYFTKESDNDFSVDRKRQNEVNEKINGFLMKKKGILMLFPEGQLSKNADELQSFRRGSFGLALQHETRIYALLHHGTNKTWPRNSSLGGYRGTIKYELIDLEVNYKDKKGVCLTASTLSDYCQAKMQKSLERLISNECA